MGSSSFSGYWYSFIANQDLLHSRGNHLEALSPSSKAIAETKGKKGKRWQGTAADLEKQLLSLRTRQARAKWLRSVGARALTSFDQLSPDDLLVVLPTEGFVWIAELAVFDPDSMFPMRFIWHRNVAGPLSAYGHHDEDLEFAFNLGWHIFRLPWMNAPSVSRRREIISIKEGLIQQAKVREHAVVRILDSLRPFLESRRWTDSRTQKPIRIRLDRYSDTNWPAYRDFRKPKVLKLVTRPDVDPEVVVAYLETLLNPQEAQQVRNWWEQFKRGGLKAFPLLDQTDRIFESTESVGERLQEELEPVWNFVTDWIKGLVPQKEWFDSRPRRFAVQRNAEEFPEISGVVDSQSRESWQMNHMVAVTLSEQRQLVTTFYVHPRGSPYTLFWYAASIIGEFVKGSPPDTHASQQIRTEFSQRSNGWEANWRPASDLLEKRLELGSFNSLALEILRQGGIEGVLALSRFLGACPDFPPTLRISQLASNEFADLVGRPIVLKELKKGDLLIKGYSIIGLPTFWLVDEWEKERRNPLHLRPIRNGSDSLVSSDSIKKDYRLLATKKELEQMITQGDLTDGFTGRHIFHYLGIEPPSKAQETKEVNFREIQPVELAL